MKNECSTIWLLPVIYTCISMFKRMCINLTVSQATCLEIVSSLKLL